MHFDVNTEEGRAHVRQRTWKLPKEGQDNDGTSMFFKRDSVEITKSLMAGGQDKFECVEVRLMKENWTRLSPIGSMWQRNHFKMKLHCQEHGIPKHIH